MHQATWIVREASSFLAQQLSAGIAAAADAHERLAWAKVKANNT